ncbi:MAG TPA: hypothetical protein VGF94_08030 [Kofleriaceae bacterium]|jgi:hypothetical protein
MSTDPGISRGADESARDTSVHLNLPIWAQNPRWPSVLPPDWLDSKPRARGVKLKRRFDPELVKACLSGNELVAGFTSGRSKPYRLDRPKIGIAYPKTSSFDARAVWKLRGTYLLALEWIEYAKSVRKRAGLNASHAELGLVCGVKADRMYQVLRDLRAWKLVRQCPSFVPLGRVSSQRANCYQLTNVAANAFGLQDASCYPDPEDDCPPAMKPRPRKAAPPSGAGGGGDEPPPRISEETTTQSGNPTVLVTSSAEIFEHAPCHGAPRDAVSAPVAPTSIVLHVPAGSSDAVQPDSAVESCELSSRLSEPESGEAPPVVDASSGRELAGNLRAPLERLRRGDFDDPETAKARRRRDDDAARRRGAEREREEQLEHDRVVNRPVEFRGDDKLQGRVIAGPDEQRKHREQRELLRRQREDADVADAIAGAWKSRGLPITIAAQISIDKIKNGGGS